MQLNCIGGFFKVTDPVEVYKFNYWLYVLTGCWKYESSIRWKENLFKAYQGMVALFYILIVILFGIDAFSVRHDLDKLSFNMTSSVLAFITVLKVIMVRRQRNKVEVVLQNLNNNFNLKRIEKEDKDVLDKRAQLILGLTRMLYSMLVVCYFIRVISDTALDTRAFLVPMPFTEHLEKHFEIVYMQQMIVITHFLVTVIAHDLFIYGMVNRFLAHFEVLEKHFLLIKEIYPKTNFEKYVAGYTEHKNTVKNVLLRRNELNLVKDLYEKYKYDKMYEAEREKFKEERARQILTESIDHHQKLLKQVKNFCQVYNQPFVVQVLGTVLLIGIVAVKILFVISLPLFGFLQIIGQIIYLCFCLQLSNQITPLLIQQVMYVGITLINNLYLCSFGSELSSKSRAAANALYDTPWYEMDMKNRKILHFTMRNLMKGPKMRAGNLIVIDRVTYLKMLQTSYNMVVVLQNIY